MTIDERFERIEHVTAGWIDQSRREREEDRALWRDTQRQINELSVRMVQIGDESRAADRRLGERLEQLALENRQVHAEAVERDRQLDERIAALVSAIGEFIAAQKPQS